MSNKLKRLQISSDLFFSLFTAGLHEWPYEVVRDAVPEDAELVSITLDTLCSPPRMIGLLIRSESFPDVIDGQLIPDLLPLCERLAPQTPQQRERAECDSLGSK